MDEPGHVTKFIGKGHVILRKLANFIDFTTLHVILRKKLFQLTFKLIFKLIRDRFFD